VRALEGVSPPDRKESVEDLIQEFDENRNFKKEKPELVKEAEQQREYFISKFPMQKISEMKLDDYVAGKVPKNKDSFSNLVEYGTSTYGSVGGGSARKHGISVIKATQEYRYKTNVFSSSNEAFNSIKNGIIETLKAAQQLVKDKDWEKFSNKVEGRENFVSLSIMTKIVSLYFPDEFIRIWSHDWVNSAQ